MIKKTIRIPYYKQREDYTCGPAALRMIFRFFGLKTSEKRLAKLAGTNKDEGTSREEIVRVARTYGFHCYVNRYASLHMIKHFIEIGLPVIVNYKEPSKNEGHYAVVVGYDMKNMILNDPWNGKEFSLSIEEFMRRWRRKSGKKPRRWILVLSKKEVEIGTKHEPVSTH